MPAEGELHAYARCPLDLGALSGAIRWIAGENRFQALCLALDHLRTVLRIARANGECICWGYSDHEIDIDSPWFAPMLTSAEDRGGDLPPPS